MRKDPTEANFDVQLPLLPRCPVLGVAGLTAASQIRCYVSRLGRLLVPELCREAGGETPLTEDERQI